MTRTRPTQSPHQNRQRSPQANDKGEQVAVLSSAPLEREPERNGEVTQALASVLTPTYDKGTSIGVEEEAERVAEEEARIAAEEAAALAAGQEPAPRPTKTMYRVLADKQITSATGRTILRTGKELDAVQYNIKALKGQGVQLEEFEVEVL